MLGLQLLPAVPLPPPGGLGKVVLDVVVSLFLKILSETERKPGQLLLDQVINH